MPRTHENAANHVPLCCHSQIPDVFMIHPYILLFRQTIQEPTSIILNVTLPDKDALPDIIQFIVTYFT